MIISMGDLSEEVLTEADSVRTSLSSLKAFTDQNVARRVVATKPLRGGYSDGVDTIAHRKKARPAHLTAPRATLERLTSLLKRTGFRILLTTNDTRRILRGAARPSTVL